MVPSKRPGGKPLLWAVFWVKGLSPASSLALRGFMSLLKLSAPGTGMFGGWLGEFADVPMPFPAAESSSPPALSLPALALRLAALPAAFHCRLFIRLNSLRFLSCSLRGTEGELVPADGPHPPHPAGLERGLEKRDAGEGGISHPCGAPAPLPSKYGKRSA